MIKQWNLYPSTCCIASVQSVPTCNHFDIQAVRICYRIMSLMPCLTFHQATPSFYYLLTLHFHFQVDSLTFNLFRFIRLDCVLCSVKIDSLDTIMVHHQNAIHCCVCVCSANSSVCTVQSHPFYSAFIGQCNIFLLQCLHNAISCTFSEQDPCSGQMVYEYVCTHSVYRFSILYVLAKYLRSLHIDIPHRRTTTTSAHKPKIKKHPTVGKADKIRKYQGQCTDVHFGACFYVVRVLLMNRIQFILILNFCTKYGIASEIATSPILMLISSTY